MRLALLLPILLLLLVPVVARGQDVERPIEVGISDQNVDTFDSPQYAQGGFRRVRYFVPWNVMENTEQRLKARAFVMRARQKNQGILLHLSTDYYELKRAKLPSVLRYQRNAARTVAYFRRLGVRDFGVWNEANHASQPTYRSPRRAAEYFRVMWREVKKRCEGCGVVALDVLDQRGVERYMERFYRELSPTFRRRATIIGLHNYGDVNLKRTKTTQAVIDTAHLSTPRARIWFTETGGIVKSVNFPYSVQRARNRLSTMFSLADRFHRQGVDRLYIYNWKGAQPDARFDAGLTNPDGSARPGLTYVIAKVQSYLR